MSQKRIKQLREYLKYQDYHYYVLDDPIISDYEYDILKRELQKLEAKSKTPIPPDSPTQLVNGGFSGYGSDVKFLRMPYTPPLTPPTLH